jgi:hypothetical protein
MALITPAHAANLRSFVYVGKDNSILYNYALSDWAQFLVDRATPPWVAPNTITLLGLFATLFATVVCPSQATHPRVPPVHWTYNPAPQLAPSGAPPADPLQGAHCPCRTPLEYPPGG